MNGIQLVVILQALTLAALLWPALPGAEVESPVGIVAAEEADRDRRAAPETWRELGDGLARLEEQVRSLADRVAEHDLRPVTDVRTNDDVSAQRELRRSVDRLWTTLSRRSGERGASLRQLRTSNAIRWPAIEALAHLAKTDGKEAQAAIQLLTVDEVLQRFGPPSRIGYSGNYSNWYYIRYKIPFAPKSGTNGSFTIYFRDGVTARARWNLP